MPSALIWGCLKVVVDSSKRYLSLYENIEEQVALLNYHIDNLNTCEDLLGGSPRMQNLIQESYIDIIRFWLRVEEECDRCAENRLLRSTFPFSVTKIDEITIRIEKTADKIDRLAFFLKGQIDRSEQLSAARERGLAEIAGEQQSSFDKRFDEDRNADKGSTLRTWLNPASLALNESNFHQQKKYRKSRSPQTCDWLFDHINMRLWLDIKSSDCLLWVKGGPGVGKSTITAYAIEKVSNSVPPTSAVIYHFF
ncbi:uncharacterized protein N7483_012527 [Penicillium malachiteum]|uniref:uncharacterized protein n=1 Tax=Penicillium malachiteum TaxID=1324776 RepID=UPI0025480D04|nr:uncharacterized protein N7483_012527 [Penicillium malachiteum]KAJ5715346.1 hypothetical protein N7483_012527 [Penicillium malachiteum]